MRSVFVMTLLMVCVTPTFAVGETCAATPEAAAKATLGGEPAKRVSAGGFHAEDVEVDPVLRRAWVRVRRCDAPDAPAILVPFSIPVKSPAVVVSDTSLPGVPVQQVVPSHPLLVHAGDWVHAVFLSSVMRMEVEARAMQPGWEGQTISLIVKRSAGMTADEHEHRIHGMVRADGMVEVVP